MAGKTIVALYDDFADAARAVRALEQAGFQHKDISLVANNSENRWSDDEHDEGERATHASDGAGTGATIGAVAGGAAGLLASLGVLAIPGVGPVLAAGPLVAMITGAGVGAAAGGLIGGLVGLGVPETEAHAYAEGVRRGGALVTAKIAESRVQRAIDILERHDAVDVEQRQDSWRRGGWKGFDDQAEPLSGEAIEQERTRWRGAARTTGVGFESSVGSGRIAAEASALDAPVTPSTAGVAATSGGTGNAPRVPPTMPGGGASDGARGISGGDLGATAMAGGTASADTRNPAKKAAGERRPRGRTRAPQESSSGPSSTIRQESETARMSGGPVPTAMSGMAGSAEGLREQHEPLKHHGDMAQRRVRSYTEGGAATDRAAAADKPMHTDDRLVPRR